MKHGFIGFGNVARAIHNGLSDDPTNEFRYHSRTNSHSEIMAMDSLDELVEFADFIWLCVKPQTLGSVLEEMRGLDFGNTVVVSPVAGKGCKYIEEGLGSIPLIIRIMPNLAMEFKRSVTAFYSNNREDVRTDLARNILLRLGKLVDLPEEDFHLFTAIYGSGPAFLLEILSVFKRMTGKFNIPHETLDELLIELTVGSVIYFQRNHPQKSVEELVRQVTSKGGTTQAGLEFYRDNDIDILLQNMLEAATKRSRELGD